MSTEPASADHDDPRNRWNSRYRSKWGAADNGNDHRREQNLLVVDEPPTLTRLLSGAGLSKPPSSGASPDPDLTGSSQSDRRPFAVDLAGGDGHGAVALALMGFAAVVVDVADVALDVAKRRAEVAGVNIATVLVDLQAMTLGQVLDLLKREVPGLAAAVGQRTGPESGLLLVCTHYLNRPLLRSVPEDLPPGATFAASIATKKNLERNRRPSAGFLLEQGELVRLIAGSASGYEVLHEKEHWTPEGTNEAEVVVSRIHP